MRAACVRHPGVVITMDAGCRHRLMYRESRANHARLVCEEAAAQRERQIFSSEALQDTTILSVGHAEPSPHMQRAVELLGRRCSPHGDVARATRTLIPIVHRLAYGTRYSTYDKCVIALGVGNREVELDGPLARELEVDILIALHGDEVTGAALLTKAAPAGRVSGFVVVQLLAVDERFEKTGIGSALLDATCAVARAYDSRGALVVPATSKWWAGASKAHWLENLRDEGFDETGAAADILRRLPCLFDVRDMPLLWWRCAEARVGWIHSNEPSLPLATVRAHIMGSAESMVAAEATRVSDALEQIQMHAPPYGPPPPPRQPKKDGRSSYKNRPGQKQPSVSTASLPSSTASVGAQPSRAPKPVKEAYQRGRSKHTPWWAAEPSYMPPPGNAGAFAVDTTRRGLDERLWRAVAIYDPPDAPISKRHKVCDEWMPLDDHKKLVRPPPGVPVVTIATIDANPPKPVFALGGAPAPASSSMLRGPAPNSRLPTGRAPNSRLPTGGRHAVLMALFDGQRSVNDLVDHAMRHSSYGVHLAAGQRNQQLRATVSSERDSAIPLWVRNGDGVVLTPAGEAWRAEVTAAADDSELAAAPCAPLASAPPLAPLAAAPPAEPLFADYDPSVALLQCDETLLSAADALGLLAPAMMTAPGPLTAGAAASSSTLGGRGGGFAPNSRLPTGGRHAILMALFDGQRSVNDVVEYAVSHSSYGIDTAVGQWTTFANRLNSEKTMAIPLWVRNGDGVVLTPAGEAWRAEATAATVAPTLAAPGAPMISGEDVPAFGPLQVDEAMDALGLLASLDEDPDDEAVAPGGHDEIEDTEVHAYAKGSRVAVHFDREPYPGVVIGFSGSMYEVRFDDGSVHDDIFETEITLLSEHMAQGEPALTSPPPPPADWLWPFEGDTVEVDVEGIGWARGTVTAVLMDSLFSVEIVLPDDSWTDWFNWQEEGVDWRRHVEASAGEQNSFDDRVTEIDGFQLHLSDTGSTGYRGVYPTDGGRFTARYWQGGKTPRVTLGVFDTVLKAALAYARYLDICRLVEEEEEEEAQEPTVGEVDGVQLHLSDKGSTGYRGVYATAYGRFSAKYHRSGHAKCHLGTFDTKTEAALAYARHVDVLGEDGSAGEHEHAEEDGEAEHEHEQEEDAVPSESGRRTGRQRMPTQLLTATEDPRPKPLWYRKQMQSQEGYAEDLMKEEEEEEGQVVAEFDGVKLHLADKGSTGYRGVVPTDSGRFTARYHRGGGMPKVSLGVFDTVVEAALAYARYVGGNEEEAAEHEQEEDAVLSESGRRTGRQRIETQLLTATEDPRKKPLWYRKQMQSQNGHAEDDEMQEDGEEEEEDVEAQQLGASAPAVNSGRGEVLSALFAGSRSRDEIVSYISRASSRPRAAIVTVLGKEKTMSVPLWQQGEVSTYQLTDAGEALRGTDGYSLGKENSPAPPGRETGRGLVLAALLSGCTSRDDVIDHVSRHSQYGTNTTDGQRAAVLTVLGKEKAQAAPLWTQEENRYFLTRVGELHRGADGFDAVKSKAAVEAADGAAGFDAVKLEAAAGAADSAATSALRAPSPLQCQRVHEAQGGAFGCTLPAYHSGEHNCESLRLWPGKATLPVRVLPAFAQGDLVQARYRAACLGPTRTLWFDGRVEHVHENGAYDIAYEDGDREERVLPKYVRRRRVVQGPSEALDEEPSAEPSEEPSGEGAEPEGGEQAADGDGIQIRRRLRRLVSTTSEAAQMHAAIRASLADTTGDGGVPAATPTAAAGDGEAGPSRWRQAAQAVANEDEDEEVVEVDDDEDDDDVVELDGCWDRVDLRCAISMKRLTDPARGSECMHRAVVNFDALVQYSGRICAMPYCDAQIRRRTLVRDDKLHDLLAKLPPGLDVAWVRDGEIRTEAPPAPTPLRGQVSRKRPLAQPARRAQTRRKVVVSVDD